MSTTSVWGEKPVKDSPSVNEAVKDLLENSSAHGLPNIHRATSIPAKLSWCILFLLAVTMVVWQVVTLFQVYFSYPVGVSLTVQFEPTMLFPAVTVCNVNPIRMIQLQTASDTGLRSMFDPSFVPPGLGGGHREPPGGGGGGGGGAGNGIGGGGGIGGVQSWGERLNNDFYRQPSESFSKANSLTVLMGNQSEDVKRDMGHQLSTMLLDCAWRGYPCSPDNFTQYYNHKYGNCYTFNSGRYEAPLTTNKPGPMYGLSLELYIEQSEYMVGTTESAGVRVLIHHQDRMPFPEDDGFSVAPGHAFSVGVRQMEILRQGPPYGDCQDTDSLSQEEIDKNIFMSKYNVGYSVQVCERSCYQHNVIDRCDCFDSQYPIPEEHEGSYYPCDIVNDQEEKECVDKVESLYDEDELSCNCPRSCRDKLYLPTVTSLMWPADSYQATLFGKMSSANGEMRKQMRGSSPKDWTRENVLKLDVYFEMLNYEYIEEYPSYLIEDLLSDMGGQLGLWIGVSIITVFEMIQFLLSVISLCCGQMTNKSRIQTSDHTLTNVEQIQYPSLYDHKMMMSKA
ncbi:epithelial sodium channel subunit alpha-like [Glandiceps talaboti]